MRATYLGGKKIEGARGSLYRFAEKHLAYYSLNHSKSFWYSGNDLKIAVLFKDEASGQKFQTCLGQLYIDNPAVKRGDIYVEKDLRIVNVDEHTLERVFLSDCDETVIYGSSLETLFHTQSTRSDSTVSDVTMSDPLVQYQSIEKPQEFNLTSTRPYRCRLKPKATFKEVSNDPNNQLAVSWLFRQYLDGLHTEDFTGKEDVPQLAIYVSDSNCNKQTVVSDSGPFVKRTKVTLNLEFRSPNIASFMGQRLKDNSRKLSETQWETFVFVTDPQVFHECLLWKYHDTKKKVERGG